MKAKEFRNKYKETYRIRPLRKVTKEAIVDAKVIENNKSFLYKSINKDFTNSNDLKIIGVSGSKGKSTVCYLLHNALKEKGKKSILYSSIEIDSELSYNLKGSVENPLKDNEMLLNAINEAIEAEAEYLILEVNERAIKNQIIDDLDFDMKVITNIHPKHNNYLYPDYEEIKKSFFLNNNNPNTKLLLGITNQEAYDLYNRLNKKIVFTTAYLKERFNIKDEDVNYYLKENENELDTIEGLDFDVYTKYNKVNFKSNLIMMHNALNIGLVYAILQELGEYDYNSFMKVLNTISIPGRCEVFNYNDKKVIVSFALDPELENLKRYKDRKQINNIKVVTGASGLGHKTWGKEFSSDAYIEEKMEGMNFAYNYIQKYADMVYITSSDSGATNKEELINHQSSLVTKINKECYENRKYAIYKAIKDAANKDVILISGRGNRKILCDGYESVSFLLDKDVVLEVINDLKKDKLW